jgi:hypothetical protein
MLNVQHIISVKTNMLLFDIEQIFITCFFTHIYTMHTINIDP